LKAIIFDVDGTLAETEEAHREAFNGAFEKFGLDWCWSQHDYRQLLKTTGGKERIRAHMNAIGFTHDGPQPLKDYIAEIHAHKTGLYTSIIDGGAVPLRPGVGDLMEECRRAGLRMAIATTTSQPNVISLVKATLGGHGMELFEVLSCGDMVAKKKPAPDIYLKALEELDLPAQNCLALEDSLNGLKSALAARIVTVVTPSIYTDDDDFTAAALVTPTLAELAGGAHRSILSALRACHQGSVCAAR